MPQKIILPGQIFLKKPQTNKKHNLTGLAEKIIMSLQK